MQEKRPFKKKENYRLVSVLSAISRVFKKRMQKKIVGYIETFLCSYLCGYGKNLNTQQALLAIIENWKKALDNKGFEGALLMDLSKAVGTINHALLIPKLHVNSFGNDSLKLLYSYLNNRWYRTKANQKFSAWKKLSQGFLKGLSLDLFYLIFI